MCPGIIDLQPSEYTISNRVTYPSIRKDDISKYSYTEKFQKLDNVVRGVTGVWEQNNPKKEEEVKALGDAGVHLSWLKPSDDSKASLGRHCETVMYLISAKDLEPRMTKSRASASKRLEEVQSKARDVAESAYSVYLHGVDLTSAVDSRENESLLRSVSGKVKGTRDDLIRAEKSERILRQVAKNIFGF